MPGGIINDSGNIQVGIRSDGVILEVTSQYLHFASKKRAEMLSVREAITRIEQEKYVMAGGQSAWNKIWVDSISLEYRMYENDEGDPVIQPVYFMNGSAPIGGLARDGATCVVQANRF